MHGVKGIFSLGGGMDSDCSCFSCDSEAINHVILFDFQAQAVFISGELVFSVMLRKHSVHMLSHLTLTLRCPVWYQVT